MRIILLADKEQKEEFLGSDADEAPGIVWSDKLSSVKNGEDADACIDLLFDNTAERLQTLQDLKSKMIIVNSVIEPLNKPEIDIVRMNGWTTFLRRAIVEASAKEHLQPAAEQIFNAIKKNVEWVPDVTGFITSRVVASIINEAYFALQEKVSSKDEIDIAMKLGTNYPYGPFEWGRKIGLTNVHGLLKALSAEEKRYVPAALLTKEAMS